MFDFEQTMKIIVALAAAGFTFVMMGLGIKVLFFRRRELPGTAGADLIGALEERLVRTEAKVTELEERLDFAERMLTDVRGKAQLPSKP